ncbi:MAG: exopolyphosphatase [Ferruginibacter sp.]
MTLAAIDIGSNAARLLITEVSLNEHDEPVFNKKNLVRVPLRLGFDVFEFGYITQERIDMLIQTMKAYRHLLNAYQVDAIKVCATSAMRDADNAKDVLNQVRRETGLDIEVISGEMEANLVYENHIAENLDKEHSYLYIDVGGGSTEISFFTNGRLALKKSFNIGTIRLLKQKVSDKEWDEMKDSIKQATRGQKGETAIWKRNISKSVFSEQEKLTSHNPQVTRNCIMSWMPCHSKSASPGMACAATGPM